MGGRGRSVSGDMTPWALCRTLVLTQQPVRTGCPRLRLPSGMKLPLPWVIQAPWEATLVGGQHSRKVLALHRTGSCNQRCVSSALPAPGPEQALS